MLVFSHRALDGIVEIKALLSFKVCQVSSVVVKLVNDLGMGDVLGVLGRITCSSKSLFLVGVLSCSSCKSQKLCGFNADLTLRTDPNWPEVQVLWCNFLLLGKCWGAIAIKSSFH